MTSIYLVEGSIYASRSCAVASAEVLASLRDHAVCIERINIPDNLTRFVDSTIPPGQYLQRKRAQQRRTSDES